METITLQERTVAPYLTDPRNSNPSLTNDLLAVTSKGTGQIITLSREGISFGCLYPHLFPQEWNLDILDARGCHIQQLKVRKVWEMNKFHTDFCKEFELVVGAQFVELSDIQLTALENILEKQAN